MRGPLERLTVPLVRDRRPDDSGGDSGGGSRGTLRPASWDEALGRAAEGLLASKRRHGPRSIGVFSCSKATNEVNYLAQKVLRVAIGSNNIDSCNRT